MSLTTHSTTEYLPITQKSTVSMVWKWPRGYVLPVMKYSKVVDDLTAQYKLADVTDRKTRYAREGYEYVPASSSPDGK